MALLVIANRKEQRTRDSTRRWAGQAIRHLLVARANGIVNEEGQQQERDVCVVLDDAAAGTEDARLRKRASRSACFPSLVHSDDSNGECGGVQPPSPPPPTR
jgi:hypothetical protein